jgi:hypothetical protein
MGVKVAKANKEELQRFETANQEACIQKNLLDRECINPGFDEPGIFFEIEAQ